jgi:LPXTG-motif cell wall-anchored protein
MRNTLDLGGAGESWVPPASCGSATPDPAASSADPTGQALPATGNGVGTPIAIGAGLLAAGVILISALFVFRRRRSIAGS